jgi:hypothetical protein
MTLRLTRIAKWNTRIFALMAGASSLCSLAPTTLLAQDPIRVQTNQVLVPVIVADKERLHRYWKDGSVYNAVLPGEVDAILSGLLVHNLAAADFQVLDDGKEQPIQNLTEEPSLYWNVRDNIGHHTEYIGPAGGKWSTAEWPPAFTGDLNAPQHYVIAYAVPESPDGSCHHISVKVNRPNALVAARGEYCNTRHSASDPLNGTAFGKQMENHLASPEGNNVDISVLATALYSGHDAARVHIAVDWPWESLKAESSKGVLVMVFSKEGKLVTRFSDLAEREGLSDRDWRDWPTWDNHRWYTKNAEMGVVESRYETQIKLPPGEYGLRVVLGGGKEIWPSRNPFNRGRLRPKGIGHQRGCSLQAN